MDSISPDGVFVVQSFSRRGLSFSGLAIINAAREIAGEKLFVQEEEGRGVRIGKRDPFQSREFIVLVSQDGETYAGEVLIGHQYRHVALAHYYWGGPPSQVRYEDFEEACANRIADYRKQLMRLLGIPVN